MKDFGAAVKITEQVEAMYGRATSDSFEKLLTEQYEQKLCYCTCCLLQFMYWFSFSTPFSNMNCVQSNRKFYLTREKICSIGLNFLALGFRFWATLGKR